MTTDYAISYAPLAYEDLLEIFWYISEELGAPMAARGQVDRIRKAARGLTHFPEKHEAVAWEPWKSAGVRQLPVDHYILFYQIRETERTVLILRIFYGGRNIKEIVATSE